MAFWGAPIANPLHAADACRAALEFQKRLANQRTVWEASGQPLVRTRIGINTGRMLVGNVGSNERLNYTVIGDSVNIASRLEALNKVYGTQIMIGEDTHLAAGDRIITRRLDLVTVYGRLNGIAIYELLGMADGSPPPPWVESYERGLESYAQRDWQAAMQSFTEARQSRGGDTPSDIFIARCQDLLDSPPGPDWSPLVVLDAK